MNNELGKRRNVTLTLTETCNLDCIYCYEANKSTGHLSVELAKKIIDEEMNRNDGVELVNFDYFGGEPFVEFERMKEIHEYLLQGKWKKKFSVSICTNGTLVHGKIKKWLLEHRNEIYLGLSFDGNKSMQDCNRSNSFDKIDIDFFAKWSKTPTVKMTISPLTLPTLAEGVIFLHNKGFNVSCNLAHNIDWNGEQNISILASELSKLIEYYLENPNIKPCRMLDFPIQHVVAEPPQMIKKWCGTGNYMVAYDVQGNSYACQFFMPLSIGKEMACSAKKHEIPSEININSLDTRCRKCPMVTICPMCLGANYSESQSFFTRSESYCKCMKVVFLANSYLQWKMLKNGQLVLKDEERKRRLNAIVLIQESMKYIK